jgi:hypothetical protein
MTRINSRQLPQRSKLVFYFPNTKGKTPIRVTLPFFENVTISESKAARYQDFRLLSRSSNLYGYLGADSRKLRLTFSMTLPHIQYNHPEVNETKYIKNDYNNLFDSFTQTSVGNDKKQKQSEMYASKYVSNISFDKVFNQVINNPDSFNNVQELLAISTAKANLETSEYLERLRENKDLQAIELVLYWTNIIRSSVVNNAQNPLLGPPIIRLSHGIMYQNIPCICKSYSFRVSGDDKAGFDIHTLMPRMITFDLELEESRTGDFKKYEKFTNVSKDNLTGYESVLSDFRSMDPGSILEDEKL